MPPVYIDFDDVISESTRACIRILKREFGKEAEFEQVHSFNFMESFNLSQAEYDHFFDCIHQPEEIMSYKPVWKAIETIKKWAEDGFEIAIVTGRLTSTFESSLEWLSEYEVPYDSFTMVDKYSRPGANMKIAITVEELSSMKFSLAVEDSPKMAEYLSKDMGVSVALFDRPWNRVLPLNEKMERYSDWDEIACLPSRNDTSQN